MRFCTNCGFALTGSPRYCAGCGIPAGQSPDSGPPATSSPLSDPPVDPGPPVPPPGQGPPDLWGQQDLRDPWSQPDPPAPWSQPDPPDLWSKPDPAAPWSKPDPPDLWSQPGPPAPWSQPDPPAPWSQPDPPDPWSQPDLPSRWGRPGTVDPRGRPDPSGPQATEQPADSPGAQDPFGYLFDASGTPTAVTPELVPVAGLPSDDSTGPDGAPDRPARSPGRLTILALVAAVALLITGSLVILRALHHNSQPNAAATRLQSPTPGRSSRGASRPAVGSDAVAIAPAAAGQPHTQQVAALLKTYFRSINSRDYVGYSRLFIPQMRESVQNFNAGYRTTTDSGATLADLSATGADGLAATVTFTSQQLPADSPDHASCDKWDVVLSLKPADGGYLITHSPAGYHPSVHPCA
jgi:hypothetical protein